MTNYVMLAIGCFLVGLSHSKGIVPEFWDSSLLCVGIVTIVWSILWDWRYIE